MLEMARLPISDRSRARAARALTCPRDRIDLVSMRPADQPGPCHTQSRRRASCYFGS